MICYENCPETLTRAFLISLWRTRCVRPRIDGIVYCLFTRTCYRVKNIIDSLKNIEENILKKVEIKNKLPQSKIYEQLKNGNIKLFNEVTKSSCSFILKISGIWETQFNYGLTYKFIKINY